jgi:ketosteroid isomerase-like protein
VTQKKQSIPIGPAYDAVSRMDADTLVALCDPDIRFESRITAIETATYEGYGGVRRYVENLAEAFEHIDVEQFDVLEHGDRVVATNRFRARGRGSGLEIEQEFYVAGIGRNGKLLWWGLFDSRTDALESVGLGDAEDRL